MTGTNGQQWTELSNVISPSITGASDVVRDPNRTSTYYVAAPKAGVFRTDNDGDTWTRIDNINTNTAIAGIADSSNIEIALFDAGTTTVIYVGVVDGTKALSDSFVAQTMYLKLSV